MTYTFRTIETRITWRETDLSRQSVLDNDGTEIGRVQTVDGYGRTYWRVLTAGPGIDVDRTREHPTRESAADAVVAARTAAADMLAVVDGLTGVDRALLDFADTNAHLHGTDMQVKTRARFDLSAAAYWQRINTLISRDEALAYKPMLVARLRRLRDRRLAARTRQETRP